MNSSNQRIIRIAGNGPVGEDTLTVHEVHYRDGAPIGYEPAATVIEGSDLPEIDRLSRDVRDAFDRPILTPMDFPLERAAGAVRTLHEVAIA